MDWMVAPSLPAFAAAFPASTGMLIFSMNRIASLRLVLWDPRHRTCYEPAPPRSLARPSRAGRRGAMGVVQRREVRAVPCCPASRGTGVTPSRRGPVRAVRTQPVQAGAGRRRAVEVEPLVPAVVVEAAHLE